MTIQFSSLTIRVGCQSYPMTMRSGRATAFWHLEILKTHKQILGKFAEIWRQLNESSYELFDTLIFSQFALLFSRNFINVESWLTPPGDGLRFTVYSRKLTLESPKIAWCHFCIIKSISIQPTSFWIHWLLSTN